MDFFDLLIHSVNFVLPAVFMATVVVAVAPWLLRGRGVGLGWGWQWAIQVAMGCAVLLVGLWGLGKDGKIATYGGLVLVATAAQWGLSAAWRK